MSPVFVPETIMVVLVGILPIGLALRLRDGRVIVSTLMLVAVAGWYLIARGDAESVAVAWTLGAATCCMTALAHYLDELQTLVEGLPQPLSEQARREPSAAFVRQPAVGPVQVARVRLNRRARLLAKRRRRDITSAPGRGSGRA